MSRLEILKFLKERMQNTSPGTCRGCPLLIYANVYWKKSLYDIDCQGDYVRLFKILNLKLQEWDGCLCLWLHNYILNVNPREVVKI